MDIFFPASGEVSHTSPIIAKMAGKFKRFALICEIGRQFFCGGKGVDNFCPLWKEFCPSGEKRGGRGGTFVRKLGKEGELSTNVQKSCNSYPRAVESCAKVCYTVAMATFTPCFQEYLHKITVDNREKFDCFSALLVEFNRKYNLTSITEAREIVYKHFLDSVIGEKLLTEGARVLEVGSGAGFPSIPLMIVREDLRFTLVESTGKKCDFLRIALQKLGLKAEVVNGRAEELARQDFRERFDVSLARAVAQLNTLAEYCLPFVKVGGYMLAYKGEGAEELQQAKRALSLLGGGKAEHFSYELPEGFGARSLIRIEKVSPTPARYPRGQGRERRDPL